MFKTLMACLTDGGNYMARKIARDYANGLIVSTCMTSDAGPETALVDSEQTSPVERYASREEALKGHVRWVEFAKGNEMNIVMLPDADGWLDEQEVVLKRGITAQEWEEDEFRPENNKES